ncbi:MULTISPECIES: cytochrome c biogenesis CcdA family protein [Glycomyces]|uniref:Cytochrome c biogenesis CcdA family protein n=2 Tax=Glycomyces TaxID=58113 RepID=A0A9X3SWK7_9ACTN|nr:cytochrome c biogenesis CcdA family protein [Glycomyces lechevalierae]MDA1387269.1 cytochrome c biogenesis CcdA family protein [Glycomyces lechevalierae]MDR7338467.1 cytochrome c-type biogenesis protein [Glycomyces lechevalierae]
MNPAETAASGPLLLAFGVAALAGLVSFASPCTLPLMPGYVSYVTGMSGQELSKDRRVGRVLIGALLFVAGFTAVYTTVVFALQSAGRALLTNSSTLETVAGIVMIAMGLMFIGLIPTRGGFAPKWRPAVGLAGAPLFGAVFALSWIPCTSPVLAAITSLAVIQDGTGRGIGLMIAYCAGLGAPFVLFAVGMHRLAGALDFLKRHGRAISIAGGVMLCLVGVALVTGAWTEFTNWLRATVGAGVSLL